MSNPGTDRAASRAPTPTLVLDGDYSDPDVIRVGSTFWMITSTIHVSPGMAVLRSADLLRWEHVGHCIADLRSLGPAYAHEGMGSRFGRGVYAGSIREHHGRFLMYFTTLDEGFFVCTAADPAGPWDRPVQLSAATMWDDPCPFWDATGAAWLVASHPGPESWFVYLIPMASDGLSIDLERRQVLDDFQTSEGNKVYQRDGWVFVLHNEVRAPGHRVAVIMRARSVHGPWEKRLLLAGGGLDRAREPNQGALVDHADGRWSFVSHHGRCGYPDGRPLSVLPVRWVDGWPVVDTAEGRLSWSPQLQSGAGLDDRQRDDDFRAGVLRPQWEWTNAPIDDRWSLHPDLGVLRLVAAPSCGDGLRTAANVLSQRISARPGRASVSVDASTLGEGAVAGLCLHSTTHPVAIGVRRVGGRVEVVIVEGSEVGYAVPAPGARLRLVVALDAHSVASFGFGPDAGDDDGIEPLGDSYRAEFAAYRGARIGLYCLAEVGAPEPGHADFRRFRYHVEV